MSNKHPEFTILIVEDNRFFRRALHEALKTRFPFSVLATAGDVEKARAKIETLRPDMIFLDIRLPDGNGLELTRELREAKDDTIICILTSHDMPEYRTEALRCGANHFFVKGLTDISEIFAVVEATLASRFRTLIVAEQPVYTEQMSALLLRTRPEAVVVRTTDWYEALDIAEAFKPHLVMLRTDADEARKRVFRDLLHARAGSQMKIAIVGDTGTGDGSSANSSSSTFSEEKAAIMSSLRARISAMSTWNTNTTSTLS
jgi:CheY-like chemotaxis protein